jgi:hypothetical protein
MWLWLRIAIGGFPPRTHNLTDTFSSSIYVYAYRIALSLEHVETNLRRASDEALPTTSQIMRDIWT